MAPPPNTQAPPTRVEYALRIILALLLAFVTIAIVFSWEKSNQKLNGNLSGKTQDEGGMF